MSVLSYDAYFVIAVDSGMDFVQFEEITRTDSHVSSKTKTYSNLSIRKTE